MGGFESQAAQPCIHSCITVLAKKTLTPNLASNLSGLLDAEPARYAPHNFLESPPNERIIFSRVDNQICNLFFNGKRMNYVPSSHHRTFSPVSLGLISTPSRLVLSHRKTDFRTAVLSVSSGHSSIY